MKIQEAQYKKVKKFVNERISDDIYGCDECGVVIDFNKNDVEYLECTIHRKNSEYESKQFCSWECVFVHLPKMKTDYFISLPLLSFDKKGLTSAKSFFEQFKKLKK